MKVTDPNLSSLGATQSASSTQNAAAAGRSQQTERTGQGTLSGSTGAGTQASGDDVHLSELVQSLRSLAAESPERQARIEQIARSYANGTYQVNSEGTASKIVADAFQS
jgi:flagellar biosynthesis anti-sigma factor FlgM